MQNEIQEMLCRTSPKEHRLLQEQPKSVYDQAEQVMDACETAWENLGIGTVIRDELS